MEQIKFKINGREVSGTASDTILDVAKRCEIDIPTLCHIDEVESAGACRLCMVEVTHPTWNGWSNLVTSCVYPVAEGIEVKTNTDKVLDTRKTIMNMLLARCPESDVLKTFAKKYCKFDHTTLTPRENPDNCILCTLCTRVCDEHSTAAISTFSRGTSKEVGVPLGSADDCVGCGACSLVCPTDHIKFEHEKGKWEIWNRKFQPALAEVNAEKCRACGRCEEVCPFHIPQVTLKQDGFPISFINPDFCQGCGLCVAACPTSAIDQKLCSEGKLFQDISDLAKSGTILFACPRTPLNTSNKSKVITLPCVGRLTLSMLMHAINAGARRIFILGRSQETCYFSNGETYAKFTLNYAEQLARLSGITDLELEFILPEQGQEGPNSFINSLNTISARNINEQDKLEPLSGFDAIKKMVYSGYSSEINTDLSLWLGAQTNKSSNIALFVGCAPILDTLNGYINGSNELADLVNQTIKLLNANDIHVQVIGGTVCHNKEDQIEGFKSLLKGQGITEILFLTPCASKNFADKLDPDIKQYNLCEYLTRFIDIKKPIDTLKIYGKPSNELPKGTPFEFISEPEIDYKLIPNNFTVEHSSWKQVISIFEQADKLGADSVLFNCPVKYLFSKLYVRDGAWRTVRSEPIFNLGLMLRACASYNPTQPNCGCDK